MARGLCLSGLMVLILAFLAVTESSAELYTYIDKDGNLTITDNAQSIPQDLRQAAKAVEIGPPLPRPGVQTNLNESKSAQGREQDVPSLFQAFVRHLKGDSAGFAGGSFIERLLLSVVIVITAACTLIIFRVLDAEKKKAISVARVVILWLVSVYILLAHTGDVVRMFSSLGYKVNEVQKGSEEKGRKAAQAVKTLDRLLDNAEKGLADADETGKKE